MNNEERESILAEKRALALIEGRKYAATRFGIAEADVCWFHSGGCYDRVGVKTQEAADKVSASVKGEAANGGLLGGYPSERSPRLIGDLT